MSQEASTERIYVNCRYIQCVDNPHPWLHKDAMHSRNFESTGLIGKKSLQMGTVSMTMDLEDCFSAFLFTNRLFTDFSSVFDLTPWLVVVKVVSYERQQWF